MVAFGVILIFVLQAIICAALASHLAGQKGYQTTPWGLIGFFFGIIGLIAAAGLPLKSASEYKQLERECPDCISTINARASVCKFCGKKFSQADITSGLVNNIHKGTIDQQTEAMEMLSNMKDSSVMPDVMTFIEMAMPPPHAYEMKPLKLAIDYTAKHATLEVNDQLISILKESRHNPKNELIIKALGDIQNPSSMPFLLTLINKNRYKDSAIKALVNYGDTALPVLEKQKEEGSKSEKRQASEIIDQIKEKQG